MTATARQSSARYERIWTDYTVELAVSPETVSDLLMDVDHWVDWVPGLLALRRFGRRPLPAGGRFWMKLKLPSLPALWVPCEMFAMGTDGWSGVEASPGTAIRHRFECTPLQDGGTSVRHVEYATGLLALVLRPFERAFRAHDVRWSKALEARFAVTRSA